MRRYDPQALIFHIAVRVRAVTKRGGQRRHDPRRLTNVRGSIRNFGGLTPTGVLPTVNAVRSDTQLVRRVGNGQTEVRDGCRSADILICDDHTLFAEALATLLTRRGHQVVAISASPPAAVNTVARVDIDVCVMDLLFPGDSGIDGTRRVREASPATRVIVLTGAGPEMHAAAADAGATAVVAKDSEVSVILDAIDRAVHDVRVRPARVSFREMIEPARAGDHVAVQASFLSPRERDVLELLVDGCDTRGVALRLGIAHSTARTHIQNVLTKLGCHSRLEVAALAVEHGLIRASVSSPLQARCVS